MHGTDMIYILNDIKRNGVSLLWNTIQLTAAALIAIYLLQAFFDYRQVEQKISRMTEHTEIYMFRDQTGDAALEELINDKKKCKKMEENYDDLQRKLQENSLHVKAFTADDSVAFPMYRGQRGEIRRALGLSKEQEELSRIQVSENFFDIYGIQWEGDKEAFVREKADTIPIVAGADLKKVYRLHDVLYDQQTQGYEIVGFMDKDSFYVAPGKTRDKILRPMRQIQTGIARQLEQEGRLESRGAWLPQKERGEIQIPGDGRHGIGGKAIGKGEKECLQAVIPGRSIYGSFGLGNISNRKNYFVPGGQSTQLIVGATPESDYQMVAVAEALYRNFGLKRVFYSAFIKVNEDSLLPDLPDGPPLLREHRLYQADWLMRYYGFRASELLSEKHPNFNVFLDPKCDWALQNLGEFPVEINRAPYETLLRVPGIGVKSAMRIVAARKQVALRFEDLKKMGVVLKRAVYFITCSGRMMYPVQIHEDAIAAQLVSEEKRKQWQLSQSGLYRQMSLFDDFHMTQA